MSGLLSQTETAAIVAVPGGELPLVITVVRVDRPQQGAHRWVWTIAGFVSTDARGGTREPVTLTGQDLYHPGSRMAGEIARVLASFVSVDSDLLAELAVRDHGRYLRVTDTGSTDEPLSQGHLPAYSARQWLLIESEGQRLGNWAAAEARA